ncbi:MAG: aminotransferase class I/II-fold pyridoxal phosphate-dependent enzyme [Pseudomonadota bacterium]
MDYEASRLRPIKASPAMAVSIKAREMRNNGFDVIDLSVGEPDFDTPSHVLDAAITAMRSGETHYTPADGTAALKDAIVGKLARENGLEYSRNEISAGNGAKQILFNALMATLEQGDEVLVPAPYWVSYTDMTMLLGGIPKMLECPLETDFKLLPDQLEAAITPKTRWLLLNSPSNPSGMAYTADELRSLGEVIARYPNLLVLSDEIYEHISYGSEQSPSLLTVCPELRDRVVVVNGVSKAYAMTGWRVGYAAGPAPLIKVMAKIQSQSTSNPCSISQAAAIAALSGPQDFIAEAKKEYLARRDIVFAALKDIPELRARRPEGAFYAFVECRSLIGRKTPNGKTLENDNDVADFLLENAHIAVVPGSAFGLSPYFRMSFATARSDLELACNRLAKSVSKLSNNI